MQGESRASYPWRAPPIGTTSRPSDAAGEFAQYFAQASISCAALLEQITTQIGLLGIVADAVCQRHFRDLAGEGGLLGSPITERASKAMRGGRAAGQFASSAIVRSP